MTSLTDKGAGILSKVVSTWPVWRQVRECVREWSRLVLGHSCDRLAQGFGCKDVVLAELPLFVGAVFVHWAEGTVCP